MNYCLNISSSSHWAQYAKSDRKINAIRVSVHEVRNSWRDRNIIQKRRLYNQVYYYSAGWNKSVNSESKWEYAFGSYFWCRIWDMCCFIFIISFNPHNPWGTSYCQICTNEKTKLQSVRWFALKIHSKEVVERVLPSSYFAKTKNFFIKITPQCAHSKWDCFKIY